MRKLRTRNMNPVKVMRFGASHVGKTCEGGRCCETKYRVFKIYLGLVLSTKAIGCLDTYLPGYISHPQDCLLK